MTTNQNRDQFDFLRQFGADKVVGATPTTMIRSEARLEQILATPQTPHGARGRATGTRRAFGVGRNPRRWAPLQWAAVPAAIAVGIAGGVFGPGVTAPTAPISVADGTADGASVDPAAVDGISVAGDSLGDLPVPEFQFITASAALGTWQAVPASLTTAQFEAADRACRAQLEPAAAGLVDSVTRSTAQAGGFAQPMDATLGDLLVADARGDWGFLAYGLATANADAQDVTNFGACFVWFPGGNTELAQVQTSMFSTGGAVTMGSGGGALTTPILGQPASNASWGGGLALENGTGFPTGTLAGDRLTFANQHEIRQFGTAFNDGSAFNAVIGMVPNLSDASIAIDGGAVTPSVSGNWFAAWWPVTFDQEAMDLQNRCHRNNAALQRVNPDAASRQWCGGLGAIFEPQLGAIAVEYGDGSLQTLTNVVGAPAGTVEFTDDEIAAMMAGFPDDPEVDFPVAEISGVRGVLPHELVTLPAFTVDGLPLTWSIDVAGGNNPGGAVLIGNVLDVGEISNPGGAYESLGLLANVQVDGHDLTLRFRLHVVSEETLTELTDSAQAAGE